MLLARVNHVALLVRSVEQGAEYLRGLGLPVGQAQTFKSEGTREIYVGEAGVSARLLLMQAITPGPYERALKKRGPGLHHIAVDVPDLAEFLRAAVRDVGWKLHPISAMSSPTVQEPAQTTAWLYASGIPTLIEAQQRPAACQVESETASDTGFRAQSSTPGLITRVAAPLARESGRKPGEMRKSEALLTAIGLQGFLDLTTDGPGRLALQNGAEISFEVLL